jgi:hypothetical protein
VTGAGFLQDFYNKPISYRQPVLNIVTGITLTLIKVKQKLPSFIVLASSAKTAKKINGANS